MPITKLNKKSKDGRNQYQVKVNYTDNQGIKRNFKRVVFGLAEAKELEEQLIADIKKLKNAPTAVPTLNQLHNELCTALQGEIRESSLSKKKRDYEHHIQPLLGDVRLDNLTPSLLIQWKSYIKEKDIVLTTQRNIYKEFRAHLNFAIRMKYITDNPLDAVGNFQDSEYEEPEMKFYTPEQFSLYKQAALQHCIQRDCMDFYVFFCIAYYTGARKGEIHALRWSRLDGNVLDIKRSINQKENGRDVETLPKTKKSKRKVKIPNALLDILNQHKQRHQHFCKTHCLEWSEDYFICGLLRPLRDSSVAYKNSKFAEAANLPHIRIHDFRHSHASLLINANVNVLDISKRLGHKDAQETLRTYAHLFPSEEDKTLDVLNKI